MQCIPPAVVQEAANTVLKVVRIESPLRECNFAMEQKTLQRSKSLPLPSLRKLDTTSSNTPSYARPHWHRPGRHTFMDLPQELRLQTYSHASSSLSRTSNLILRVYHSRDHRAKRSPEQAVWPVTLLLTSRKFYAEAYETLLTNAQVLILPRTSNTRLRISDVLRGPINQKSAHCVGSRYTP